MAETLPGTGGDTGSGGGPELSVWCLLPLMAMAYPAYLPERVLRMRADWVFMLLGARRELMSVAVPAAGTDEDAPTRTVSRTHITDVSQLKGFLSRPMNG